MTAEQAIHAFWSSFGLTAYDENSVPAGTDTLSVGTEVQPSAVKIKYKKG